MKTFTVLILLLFCIFETYAQDENQINLEPISKIGDNILISSIDIGTYSGYINSSDTVQKSKPNVYIFKTDKSLQTFWEKHKSIYIPMPACPTINFFEEDVICVILDSQKTGGYRVKVEKVIIKDNSIEVHYKMTTPKRTGYVTQVITTPYDIVRIKKIPDNYAIYLVP